MAKKWWQFYIRDKKERKKSIETIIANLKKIRDGLALFVKDASSRLARAITDGQQLEHWKDTVPADLKKNIEAALKFIHDSMSPALPFLQSYIDKIKDHIAEYEAAIRNLEKIENAFIEGGNATLARYGTRPALEHLQTILDNLKDNVNPVLRTDGAEGRGVLASFAGFQDLQIRGLLESAKKSYMPESRAGAAEGGASPDLGDWLSK